MEKKNKRPAQTTHKKPNAGSGGFNKGAEEDQHYNEGVADGSKHPERISKEKQNPKAKVNNNDIDKDEEWK